MLSGYETYSTEAERLCKTGQFSEALMAVNTALEIIPDDLRTQILKGNILLKLKKYDDLYEFCDILIAITEDPVHRDSIAIGKLMGLVQEEKAEAAIQLGETLLRNDLITKRNPLWKSLIEKKLKQARKLKELKIPPQPLLEKKEKPSSEGTSQILLALQGVKPTPAPEEKSLSSYVTVDVPNDQSCLFWSAFLALMIPTLKNPDEFNKMYARLLGAKSMYILANKQQIRVHGYNMNETFREMLKLYNCNKDSVKGMSLEFNGLDEKDKTKVIQHRYGLNLYIQAFRERVVDTMDDMYTTEQKAAIAKDWNNYTKKIREYTGWGGDPEIKAIAELAQTNISMTIGTGTPIINTPKTSTVTNTIYLVNTHTEGSTDNTHYKFKLHPDIYKKHAEQAPVFQEMDFSDSIPTKTTEEFYFAFPRSP